MKNITLLVASLILSLSSFAQAVSWGFFLEGNGNRAYKSAIDLNGNTYLLGTTGGLDVDFDPGTGVTMAGYDAGSQTQYYLTKYDATGAFQWVQILGYDYQYDVATRLCLDTDNSGNVYVAGSFRGTLDFDPGTGTQSLATGSMSNYDAFVQKFDSNGNFLQVRSVPGSGSTYLKDFTCKGNNLYFVCDVVGSNIWEIGGLESTSPRGCIATWNASMSNVETNFFGATTLRSYSIAVDDQLNKYATGFFTGSIDAPGPTGVFATGEDIFVVKYGAVAASSIPDWTAKIGSNGNDRPKDIAVDGNQNVVLVFTHGSTDSVDVDPGSGVVNHAIASGAGNMGIIVKLSGAGTYIWSNEIKSSFLGFYAGIEQVEIDADNTIYSFGTTLNGSAIDFDFSANTASQTAGPASATYVPFIQKIDENAGYEWAFFVDYGESFNIGNNGDFYLTGFTENEIANFGTSTSPFTLDASVNTNFSTFLVKYEQCVINDQVTLTSGTLTAADAAGPYQWYDCDSNLPVSGATNQSFTPTYTSDYSVQVGTGNCTVTSACTNVVVSTNELYENSLANFELYPNPASNSISIKNLEIGSTIHFIDMTGKVVVERIVSTSEVSLDLTPFNSGIYFVKVMNNASSLTQTKKLLITK